MTEQAYNEIEVEERALAMWPNLKTAEQYLKRMLEDLESAPSATHLEHLEENEWAFRTLSPISFGTIAQETETRVIPTEARGFFEENLKKVAQLAGSRCAPSIGTLIVLTRKMEGLPNERILVGSIVGGFHQASDLDYVADTHGLQQIARYAVLLKARNNKANWCAMSETIFTRLPDRLEDTRLLTSLTVSALISFLSAVKQEQLESNVDRVSVFLRHSANIMSTWSGVQLANFMHLIKQVDLYDDFLSLRKLEITEVHFKSPIHILRLATTLPIWALVRNRRAVEVITKRLMNLGPIKPTFQGFEALIGVTVNGPDWPELEDFARRHVPMLKAIKRGNSPVFIQLTVLLGVSYRIVGRGGSVPSELAQLIREVFLEWNGESYGYQHAMIIGLLIDRNKVEEIFGPDGLKVNIALKDDASLNWPEEFIRFFEIGKRELLAD